MKNVLCLLKSCYDLKKFSFSSIENEKWFDMFFHLKVYDQSKSDFYDVFFVPVRIVFRERPHNTYAFRGGGSAFC